MMRELGPRLGMSPSTRSSSRDNELSSGSALQNVFGSRVSLAELNGDIGSRLGSRQASPGPVDIEQLGTLHVRHNRTKSRSHSISRTHPTGPRPHRSLLLNALALVPVFLVGFLYGRIVLDHLSKVVPAVDGVLTTWAVQIAGGLGAVVQSVALPLFDHYFPYRKQRGKGGQDWSSIVRALAAFLGMMYAVSKLAYATLFWGLANPFLWYVLDASPNGLVLAVLAAVGGAGCFHLSFPAIGQLDDVHALAILTWIAASYFSSAIFFGNLGRRLFALR